MSKRKLLIIDDNVRYCEELEKHFASQGMFELLPSAHSGEEAISRFRHFKVDVAILDMVMPNIDGLGVLRAIHNESLQKNAMIFANTPILDDGFMLLCQSLGVAYFIAKPTSHSIMCERVIEICNRDNCVQNSQPFLSVQPVANPRSDVSLLRDVNHDELIANYLIGLGVPAHLYGYNYLKKAISYCIVHYGKRITLSKDAYPLIAAQHNTRVACVERNIRNAIEHAWCQGNSNNIEAQHKLFGYTISDKRGRPTNKEFIAMIADRTIIRLKNKNK